jgi:hypothetical protein
VFEHLGRENGTRSEWAKRGVSPSGRDAQDPINLRPEAKSQHCMFLWLCFNLANFVAGLGSATPAHRLAAESRKSSSSARSTPLKVSGVFSREDKRYEVVPSQPREQLR